MPIIALPDVVKKNKLASITMMEVYSWSVLVNTFGNIPYSQALDINNTQPVYDDAKTVTNDLFSQIGRSIEYHINS
jgi:hypothetical protein